ncbi:hypothetical protein A9K55_002528 [Cordyceps militaris]|uniref:Uncharacterized protein n=1 Tax=Cordyceps militaris TaxID=73501 RepID=A0A2H4S5R2_CORMI|nr:hypothetical protein A9K55_002528 [Cordyceps militaris]
MEACVGSRWGAIAGDVQDAPGCVRGCRDSLRRLLAPSEETYDVVCRVLARLDQPQIEDLLIGLYCCDAQLCGVDNIALPGYDPNVDLIINDDNFANKKLYLVKFPDDEAILHHVVNEAVLHYIINDAVLHYINNDNGQYRLDERGEHIIDDRHEYSVNHHAERNFDDRGTGAAPPTISSLEDPWLGENLSGGPNDATGGLSTAAKIIIGAAVGGAILVAIIAVLWHYRYGRKAREAQPPAGDSQPSLVLVPPISPTSPFLTPSPSYLGRDGVPLTPPPRLQERRLLPTGSTEQLIERGPSRLHQGFHLPTASRSGIASPYGSTVSPPLAMNAAAASAALAADRTPPSPHRGRSPYLSPTRSQFASISYASSLADPGPPPSRDLPSTPSRTATTQSGGPSRADISPNAIGVALAFPPREDNISTQVSSESGVLPHEDNVSAQVSNESGESSESKIMTGPMRGTWGDTWGGKGARAEASPAHLAPQTPTTRTSRSPILQEQELARMAGSY